MKIKLKNPLADRSPEDRTIMAICLGAAFFFWLLLQFASTHTTVREVNLAITPPSGKAIVTLPPRNLKVSVEAFGWHLLTTSDSYHVNIPLEEKTTRYNLRREVIEGMILEDLKDAKDVTVSLQGFSTQWIELEDQSSKKVPIVVQRDYSLAEKGVIANDLIVQPDSVIISGPEGLIANYDHWPTALVQFSDRLVDTQFVTTVLEKAQENVQLSLDSVSILIPIERYTERSVLVPITLLNQGQDSIRLYPDLAAVKFQIGISDYDKVDKADFELVTDFAEADLRSDNNTLIIRPGKYPEFIDSSQVRIVPRVTQFFLVEKSE